MFCSFGNYYQKMEFSLTFKVNEHIYLRNPESSDLGKKILKHSIDLIYEIGFEQFTFKKLAAVAETTEASIYRYFENKQKLLLYIINWYWCYLDFMLDYQLKNVIDKKEKIKIILHLLTDEMPNSNHEMEMNKYFIHRIVIAESSKVYLVKDVNEINQHEVFKPFKELCAKIAKVFSDYNPSYIFTKSLSSTAIETAHDQEFFVAHLPKLTDVSTKNKKNFTYTFLEDLVFKALA
jgi:AcrR family transcriptional regulator